MKSLSIFCLKNIVGRVLPTICERLVDDVPKIATVLFGIAGLGDEHLNIIQKISIFCADVDNVVKLADAQSEDEIVALLNSVE